MKEAKMAKQIRNFFIIGIGIFFFMFFIGNAFCKSGEEMSLPLDELIGIGATKETVLRDDSLEWTYNFDADNFPMIVIQSPDFEDQDGIEIKVYSEQKTKMAFILEERKGANYEFIFRVPAKKWKTISALWEDFSFQNNVPDRNKRLDIDQIKTFAIFDVAAFEGKKGENKALVQNVGTPPNEVQSAKIDEPAKVTTKKTSDVRRDVERDAKPKDDDKQDGFSLQDFFDIFEDEPAQTEPDFTIFEPTTSSTSPVSRDNYPTGERGTAKIHESGWTAPIKLSLKLNGKGWVDSPYLTRDGSKIYYFYHPWDSLADPKVVEKLQEILAFKPDEALAKGLGGNIYVSHRPFTKSERHTVFRNKKYPSSDACPYESESGNFFYTSTKESYVQGRGVKPTAYLNGKRLDFGSDADEESNPHYCDAKDEMWFDCPGDLTICVMRDAKANNWRGQVEYAPYPINSRNRDSVNDSIPFLTDDCRTLYFTSERGGNLAIYKTTRLDEDGRKWSDPKLFISHEAGVAELSMTADGREMTFSQIYWTSGGVGIDTYYSRRK